MVLIFCRRTHEQKKHGFTFLESMNVQKIRIQSFCKLQMLRHAQMQNVKTAKCFKNRQYHFLQNANSTQKFFSMKCFFQRMGASALRLRGPSGPPLISWKYIFIEKNVCVPFAFVQNGTAVF